MVIIVPAQLIIGFTIALALDQVSKFTRGIYLSIFLLPFIIVPVVGTLMFKQLFEPSGLLTWLYQTLLETKFRYNEISVKTLDHLAGHLVCNALRLGDLLCRIADIAYRTG